MNKLSLIFSLLFFLNISAQKIGPISITSGEEIEDDSQKIVKIAGESNGKIYTLAYKGKKVYIKVFSEDMKLLSVNLIEKEKL